MNNYNDNLNPEFLRRIKIFESLCRFKGLGIRATSGYRSFEEQTKLYGIGRITEGHIVTNAKAGQSSHNWGLAKDYIPIINGKATYNVSLTWWYRFGQLAKACGLQWGGFWTKFKDRPHIQLPNWKKFIKSS